VAPLIGSGDERERRQQAVTQVKLALLVLCREEEDAAHVAKWPCFFLDARVWDTVLALLIFSLKQCSS